MLYRFVLPLALLAATPAFAQTTPSPGTPSPDTQAAAPRGNGEMRERLQKAHDRLAITPAQQPQWDAMVTALRDNAPAIRARPAHRGERAERASLGAVQELRTAADRAHARGEALQRMVPSVEALYASLSPDQQRTANRELDRALHMGKGDHD